MPHDCVGQESGQVIILLRTPSTEVTRWYSPACWQVWRVPDGVLFCLSPCRGWLEGWAHLEKWTRVAYTWALQHDGLKAVRLTNWSSEVNMPRDSK